MNGNIVIGHELAVIYMISGMCIHMRHFATGAHSARTWRTLRRTVACRPEGGAEGTVLCPGEVAMAPTSPAAAVCWPAAAHVSKQLHDASAVRLRPKTTHSATRIDECRPHAKDVLCRPYAKDTLDPEQRRNLLS